ncbi:MULTISPECIES: NTPase KAP [unclassified Delftia]|uniref:NTPase KAP n=1 Tax=unclassified Delftia TaxID=2613839 RepID=UPI001901D5B0|nr:MULTISPECIES: NTPase KAP [unclassified Delftia]MBK0116096.1 NTPase KAP [Delftia sp. S65]MBK0122016.1 NTPase KAP [Delftia sp. S67]MBK0133704.1 NTPase KAP [Delftia sp. S66]
MSLSKTKARLVRLLGQDENSVIALSGKWGTGKTHLWSEVKDVSDDEKIKNALYVSLFGLSSIDQVKRKLIESAIPGVESHGGVFDGIKSLFNAGVTAASQHYKAMAALKDLNVLLMAPVVLRDKLIVIDDIESKHAKLGIDEVLGFIDDYSKQFRVRFVLVLNDDQLSTDGDQAKLWATFREKVIDEEVRLSTSPEEAFSIALKLTPSKYAQALGQAITVCGLTNIRIVGKVMKTANQILISRDLDQAIQSRVVPSIVLFSAIHYRGIQDGPDFQFALNVGNPDWVDFGRDKNAEPTEQEKREERWRLLMQELGVYGCGEFEKVLVDFLESGLFDADRVQAIIDRFVPETQALQATQAARDFLKRAFWDHRVSDADLLAEASQFPACAEFLDPYVTTQLFDTLSELTDGQALGQAIVDAWIAAFEAGDHHDVEDDNPFNNPIHPDIKAALDAAKARAQASATVVDACIDIIDNSGWGTLQEVALKRATAADFDAAIRGMDIDTLRRFMRRMIEMRLKRATYDAHFGTATQHFVDACRAISNDPNSPRLAALIKKLFARTALAVELTPPPAAQAEPVLKAN